MDVSDSFTHSSLLPLFCRQVLRTTKARETFAPSNSKGVRACKAAKMQAVFSKKVVVFACLRRFLNNWSLRGWSASCCRAATTPVYASCTFPAGVMWTGAPSPVLSSFSGFLKSLSAATCQKVR